MVPESASNTGNVILNIMRKMGWNPGQTLGINDNGLKAPLDSKLSERQIKTELGSKLKNKIELSRILNQIVNVLKLKIEESQIDEIIMYSLNSVFQEESEEMTRDNYKSEILVQIFDYDVKVLIDTGSDITCISESFWQELNGMYVREIPLMPIKPVQIKTAVGHKSVEIRNIALIPLKVGSQLIDTGFLIVPGLVNRMILGFDWLKTNEVTISVRKQSKGIKLKQGE